MGVELLEVRDFLAQHAPFDMLPPGELDKVPGQCTLRYARRGGVILDVGDRGGGLYVVRSGAVDVVDEAGGLVERVGTGSAFGMSSLLEGRAARYRCTASEDTLLLVLPPELFEALAREHVGFASFFAATHHDRLSKAIGNLRQAASGSTVLGTPVQDLVTHAPVATGPGATIEEAAAAMSQRGVSSILVVDEAGGLTGIVTDRDLRNRVLAVGLDPRRPVRDVMSSSVHTLREEAVAFEALLEMVSRSIHHLPVVDARGRPAGMVSTTDLVGLENSNPVYLAADIGRQTTLTAVVEQARRIPTVLGMLVARDASAAEIGRVVSALGDAVRRRVVVLVEAELGPPPAPYAWVVLGSAAREEEALSADQDHALVLGEPDQRDWFARLADRVTEVLVECGWPRCPGDVMATNPRWCLPVDQWRQHFATWAAEPDRESVLQAAIFYDMRHLGGDPQLTREVRRIAAASATPRLLGHLGAQALRMKPPLGFFRGFVLERKGEHRDTLDIKRAISAVVQLARVHALQSGSMALSTHSRLAAAANAGVIDEGTAADLGDAFELMSYCRLHHQVAQARAGERPDNHLAPGDLTERDRRHLKDAFGIVRSAQQQLANRLSLGYE